MGNRLCKVCRRSGTNSPVNGNKDKKITTDPPGPDLTPIDERPPTPQPTPPFPDNRARLVLAVYSYSARTEDDLSFEKGDQLEVRDASGDWWYARDRKVGKKGYIPCNYVAPLKSLEAEP